MAVGSGVALSSLPSPVAEAMAVLGLRDKYDVGLEQSSLRGKPQIFGSVDGGALSVIPSMEASSRSIFVAADTFLVSSSGQFQGKP